MFRDYTRDIDFSLILPALTHPRLGADFLGRHPDLYQVISYLTTQTERCVTPPAHLTILSIGGRIPNPTSGSIQRRHTREKSYGSICRSVVSLDDRPSPPGCPCSPQRLAGVAISQGWPAGNSIRSRWSELWP